MLGRARARAGARETSVSLTREAIGDIWTSVCMPSIPTSNTIFMDFLWCWPPVPECVRALFRSALAHTNYLIKSWIHTTWAKLINGGGKMAFLAPIHGAVTLLPMRPGHGMFCFDRLTHFCIVQINSNQSQFNAEAIGDCCPSISSSAGVSVVNVSSRSDRHYGVLQNANASNVEFSMRHFSYGKLLARLQSIRRNKLRTIGIITCMRYILLHILWSFFSSSPCHVVNAGFLLLLKPPSNNLQLLKFIRTPNEKTFARRYSFFFFAVFSFELLPVGGIHAVQRTAICELSLWSLAAHTHTDHRHRHRRRLSEQFALYLQQFFPCRLHCNRHIFPTISLFCVSSFYMISFFFFASSNHPDVTSTGFGQTPPATHSHML